ncbi:MAG: C39 family peptidase [Patescibacteria group bacterium]|nr:C39 family peptidase [Patescibacteria group bacterium]
MIDRKAKSKKQKAKILCRFAMIFLIFLLFKVVLAQSTTTNSTGSTNTADQRQIQDKQQQIEDLQKKAESYRQMIEMKQNKAQTLQNQIDLMEGQIASLESDIARLQEQINSTSADIENLGVQIDEKEKEIGSKKELLGNVLQAYYENNQDSIMEIMLRNVSLSEYLSQPDYVAQTGVKVDEVLTSVVSARDELDKDRKKLEEKNNELKEKQGQIGEKKHYLGNEQESKEVLLGETQGEEQKYQEMLVRVEQQKQELLGDIDQLSGERSSELAAVEATIEKPKSGLASTSWYFSQRDSRWGDQHIGLSNTRMRNYGCAVTAVAMVLRYHGVDINPGSLAQQPIFYHDLIVWPEQWKGIKLVSSHTHGNIDWDVVDQEIKNKNPVIVFVKSSKRGAGHYVVVHGKDKNGDYVVHDPYWGSNLFLSSTKAYVGALYGSGTVVDQMIIYH